MTTLELYNKIVLMTQRTGQGLPWFIVEKLGLEDEVEQMIEKEILVKYSSGYSSLDKWVCINGVFNPEKYYEEGHKLNSSLHFIRRWLNLDQSEDAPFMLYKDITPKEAYENWLIDSKDVYEKWLVENKEGLDAITNLKQLTELPL